MLYETVCDIFQKSFTSTEKASYIFVSIFCFLTMYYVDITVTGQFGLADQV